MTGTGLPTYLTRQFALTRPQLATELGAELLSLCQTVTADGRLAPEEIAGLQQWLGDAAAAEMQAARFLRGVIEHVLADGRITPEEYQEVYRAVEAVLPFEARQQAHAARQHAESSDLSARAPATTVTAAVAGAAQANPAPILDVTFMVAGVRQDGRPALIEQHASCWTGSDARSCRDRLTLRRSGRSAAAGRRPDRIRACCRGPADRSAAAVRGPLQRAHRSHSQLGAQPHSRRAGAFLPRRDRGHGPPGSGFLATAGTRQVAGAGCLRCSSASLPPCSCSRCCHAESGCRVKGDPGSLFAGGMAMIRPCRSSAGPLFCSLSVPPFLRHRRIPLRTVTVATAESAFLDYLDAVGAVGFIESGGAKSFGGKDLAAWTTRLDAQRKQFDEAMSRIEPGKLDAADRERALHRCASR